MTVSGDRAKALEAALAQVNKKHGADAAMLLGDKPAMKVEVISTGSLALDIALGVGGLPKGRIIEIYGPESSGKTLLCLHAIRSVQESGGLACFIDAEHALDPDWARKVGVDTDNLIISQPGSGEEALDITETMIRSGAIDLIVVDSVAALTPKKEIDGEIGDSMVGLQARMLSQAMRKLVAATNQTKTTVIFINQLREKIGVMFGSPETTTGGKALKFYASQRLDIRRIETLKVGTDPVGARTRVKVIKNKVAPPFKQAEFDILFTPGNEGFSREGDIIDIGVELNLIKKSGAWFTLAEDGSQLGQGKEKARLFLRENKELAKKLETEIRAQKLAKPEEIKDENPLDEAVPEDLLDD